MVHIIFQDNPEALLRNSTHECALIDSHGKGMKKRGKKVSLHKQINSSLLSQEVAVVALAAQIMDDSSSCTIASPPR